MTEVRIGICQCTTLWHGEFEGKKLRITKGSDGLLNPPLTIILNEVGIPEKENHGDALGSRRCHLFLDVDLTSRWGARTMLSIVRYTTPEENFGGRPNWGERKRGWWEGRVSYRPSVRTILAGLRDIIQEDLRRDQIQPWLNCQPLPQD